MASTSKEEEYEEDETQEDELERFNDFTLASSWERFISEIEAVCRQWLADGPKNLLEKGAVKLEPSQTIYKITFQLKYALKSYSMDYYFESSKSGKASDWDCNLHDLQLCFGVKEFLVIAPQSASGVVLDAPEASKLLSAIAIALSNCSSLWPAFVPVHDPSRKAFIGIQNLGTVFTRRFEADRIGSQVPVKLMHLEGLYELFLSKFAYTTIDHAMHLFKVHFTMKSTYRTPPSDDDDSNIGSPNVDTGESRRHSIADGDTLIRSQWDDDCPWSEWYSAENPVNGFELIAMWSEKMVESSLEMAELENASPHEAENWMIVPILSTDLDSSEGKRVGFASQLRLLVDALNLSYDAQFMEDYVSVENPGADTLKSTMVVPSPTVIDRMLKDLFHDGSRVSDFSQGEHKRSRAIKGAPLWSLFAQFCLHSLWIENCNIRAIAVLWIEFIREVRWCWEESQPLPKMPLDGSIDLSTCLINQKLQMLAICIERRCEMNEEFQDCIGTNDSINVHAKDDNPMNIQTACMHLSAQNQSENPDSSLVDDGLNGSKAVTSKYSVNQEEILSNVQESSDHIRKGSAGVAGSLMLLNSYQKLHAPFTQDPPLMTEDMHEERLQAVEAFGDSSNFSAQLEKDILSSGKMVENLACTIADMSAFKAANPDAVFEDFIRWHSPRDWEEDEIVGSGMSLKNNWPPKGRLSQRMSERGNLWRKIWNKVPALPVSEQKPLLDPSREGEKVLHYLETLQPHQLLEQMVCTAFRASADTLNQTNFGGLQQMTAKIEQLYLTMITILRPLQTNTVSGNSKNIEDLRRLCVVFEHVEKLLTLAASLHRKFSKAPRLSEEIFTNYFDFYVPRMGTGFLDVDQQEFNMKLKVGRKERKVISEMFAAPTANQSWRKVLSMGNLMNGHEPFCREIIFSTRDRLTNHHYASAQSPKESQQEIQTYRMYISSTSNDLRIALSTTSCD